MCLGFQKRALIEHLIQNQEMTWSHLTNRTLKKMHTRPFEDMKTLLGSKYAGNKIVLDWLQYGKEYGDFPLSFFGSFFPFFLGLN
jgi:hypothetical protein